MHTTDPGTALAQQHLDRLTVTDTGFLHLESRTAHPHIGALLLLDGSTPEAGELMDHVRARLHLMPRYRQRLAAQTSPEGRPRWVDDPSFQMENHLHHLRLDAPGSEAKLLAAIARLSAAPLDRTRPLWELWLIDGLAADRGSGSQRFALVTKVHHALVDGVGGIDLATVLMDFSATATPPDSSGLRPWRAQPTPAPNALLRLDVLETIAATAITAVRSIAALTRPRHSARAAVDVVTGLRQLGAAVLEPAPSTPLDVPIGAARRFLVVRHRLDDYRSIERAGGGTVNDVALSLVAGALGGWLRSRQIDTDGLTLRALIPVSVRRGDQHGQLGNRLTLLRGPLPVGIRDARARLRSVHSAMEALKQSKQATGASTLLAAGKLLPAHVVARATSAVLSPRLFNLLVTNVPGPQIPLYLLGRRLSDLVPLPFLLERHALAVAIVSYNGQLDYGLLADRDTVSDLQLLASGIDEALSDLIRMC